MAIENFGTKRNTNGFDKNPGNINKEGRPLSIRTDIKTILEGNGEMTIEAKNVSKIHENGNITIHLPTSEGLAVRLLEWVNSDKGNESLKAIRMIMETIDGKPTQEIDVNTNQMTPEERRKRIDQLRDKI